MKWMYVEKISIVKDGKRCRRTVIPDGYERCEEDVAEMVTWNRRVEWNEYGSTLTPVEFIRMQRPIYIKRTA